MAMDISGLTGGASANLNDELIAKLRAEDEKAQLEPIDDRLEAWTKGKEAYDRILSDITAFEETITSFTSGDVVNAVATSVTGDAVVFDALSSLEEGSYNISVSSLAKKDVWQSDAAVSSETALVGAGTFSITIDGTQHDFTTTDTTTYAELAEDINENTSFSASVAQVGDGDYRLLVKSTDTGTNNIMSFSEDLSGIDITTHSQTATNLSATIDGVPYDVSSNTIQITDSLSMTAMKVGDSSIDIQNDPTAIISAVDDFVEMYNALVTSVSNETDYNTETEEAGDLQNQSLMKNILTGVKDILFSEYGDDTGDKHNLFSFGFELDTEGLISIDEETFNDKVLNNLDDVKELFEGTAENKGLMVQMEEYVTQLDWTGGLLDTYENSMYSDETSLNEAREKAVEELDTRYSLMSAQFAEYSVIIAQMEATFSGLERQMAEAVAQTA